MAKRRSYPRSIKTRAEKARYTKTLKKELSKGRTAKYAQRVASGIARGKSKQQARGKPVREHVERAKREVEAKGITDAQLKAIRSFLSRFNPKEYKDIPTEDDLVEFVQGEGYPRFQLYRTVWDAARKAYLRELSEGTYASRGMPYLWHLQGAAKAPDERWMYYH